MIQTGRINDHMRPGVAGAKLMHGVSEGCPLSFQTNTTAEQTSALGAQDAKRLGLIFEP